MSEGEKRALIFGAGGFVSRYMMQELKSHGYRVFGCDLVENLNADLCEAYTVCDILDEEQVRKTVSRFHPSHIVNLAAIGSVGLSWRVPQKTISVNVNGSLNILEAAREFCPGAVILMIGSSEEYAVSDRPIDENTDLDANNPYGISKFVSEKFSSIYRQRYGMKIFHVRAFNHTGIGQRESFVIPSWCRQAANISKSGKPGIMLVGNVSVVRDLSDVRDIVRAYRMVLESDNCDLVYNIGSGRGIALGEILDYLKELSRQPITVRQDPALFRPADNPSIVCDHSLITNRLGWKPEHDIFVTVKEIFEFMERDPSSASV